VTSIALTASDARSADPHAASSANSPIAHGPTLIRIAELPFLNPIRRALQHIGRAGAMAAVRHDLTTRAGSAAIIPCRRG
jgi:hypothetical protein